MTYSKCPIPYGMSFLPGLRSGRFAAAQAELWGGGLHLILPRGEAAGGLCRAAGPEKPGAEGNDTGNCVWKGNVGCPRSGG